MGGLTSIRRLIETKIFFCEKKFTEELQSESKKMGEK